MADPESEISKRDQALEFLDEMEVRHDHLLQELDALNLRIDSILDAYAKSRSPHANPAPAGRPLNHWPLNRWLQFRPSRA